MRDAPLGGWTRRYLDLLEVDPAPPSREALAALTRAHVERVPFESITSVLRRATAPSGPVPSLDFGEVLDAWHARRAGGLCFSVSDMLGALLSNLGYQVFPVLCTISFPDSHQALVVEIAASAGTSEGARYLVDAGNGAPLFEPIPLDRSIEMHHAGLSYRFRPGDEPATWLQDRLIEGAWQPFCTYGLEPAPSSARQAAYQRHHTQGQSWVVDNLVLIRCQPEVVHVLRDQHLRRFTSSGQHTEQLDAAADYAAVAADVFGLPNLPIEAARQALALSTARPARHLHGNLALSTARPAPPPAR